MKTGDGRAVAPMHWALPHGCLRQAHASAIVRRPLRISPEAGGAVRIVFRRRPVPGRSAGPRNAQDIPRLGVSSPGSGHAGFRTDPCPGRGAGLGLARQRHWALARLHSAPRVAPPGPRRTRRSPVPGRSTGERRGRGSTPAGQGTDRPVAHAGSVFGRRFGGRFRHRSAGRRSPGLPGVRRARGRAGVAALTPPWDDPYVFGTATLPFVELAKPDDFVPNRIGYVHAYLFSPRGGPVRGVVDHNFGLKVWVNGREVYREPKTQRGPGAVRWRSAATSWNSMSPSPPVRVYAPAGLEPAAGQVQHIEPRGLQGSRILPAANGPAGRSLRNPEHPLAERASGAQHVDADRGP